MVRYELTTFLRNLLYSLVHVGKISSVATTHILLNAQHNIITKGKLECSVFFEEKNIELIFYIKILYSTMCQNPVGIKKAVYFKSHFDFLTTQTRHWHKQYSVMKKLSKKFSFFQKWYSQKSLFIGLYF